MKTNTFDIYMKAFVRNAPAVFPTIDFVPVKQAPQNIDQ